MNNMFYYRYTFTIIERGLRYKDSIDANNQKYAYEQMRRKHPYAETITIMNSSKNINY